MSNMGDNTSASLWGRTGDDVSHKTVHHHDPIMSDEAREVLEIIFFSAIGGVIGVLGAAANVINFIVFVKQGFNDSVGISLCALALSDLGFLIPMIWISISSNPMVRYLDTNVDTTQIQYIAGGFFESCFVRITNLITAFITFERCVCVALPLKVKNIITPKRTLISIVVMYIIIFALNLIIFSDVYLGASFNAKRNITLIGFMHTRSLNYEDIASAFNVSVQLIAFTFVIICTVILVLKLLAKSQKFHEIVSPSDVSDSISTRDKRVIKMVVFIAIIFIACYFPSVINLALIFCLSPEYTITGSYENSYFISWAIINSIDGINSSVTILIYYNMSSKFRLTCKSLFFISPKSPVDDYTHMLKNNAK